MLFVRDLSKRYRNSSQALRSVSFTANSGEFLTILGESGSGKTTLLRIVAGLEHPTSAAQLELDGESLLGVPAAKRNCTTVFQSYALFPHMNVIENVQYGLKIRRINRSLSHDKAISALRMVRLEDKAKVSVNQLSGGEKQRVALARALVVEPRLLLLDEPLGALDEKLRHHMQTELVDLHKTLGITFIYVTHSQQEALSMSDRIVLMSLGNIRQIGTPRDLFDSPNSRFAAEFMGYENILPVTISNINDGAVEAELNELPLRGRFGGHGVSVAPRDAVMAVRAERIKLLRAPKDSNKAVNTLPCRLETKEYRGRYTDMVADTPCGKVRLRAFGEAEYADEDQYVVQWDPSDAVVIPS